jgi:PQQ-dependent dehydrogenase (s-GDH family)
MHLSRVRRAATAALVALATGTLVAQNPRTSQTPGPETFSRRIITTGLQNPWTVVWGPDGYLWVTERTSFRVTRVDPASGSKYVALSLDGVYQQLVQDGLMGMALHPDLLKGRGRDHVFVAYTYDADAGPALAQRMRVRRYTFDAATGTLGSPTDVIDNLPAHDDHGGGALVVGPDGMLYLSRGDEGGNWLANYCRPIRSQDLPTDADVAKRDWTTYQGKTLRMNLDGSIPADNPRIAGVRSHVYTYGHRNIQGLVFAPDGTLYASEHGPSTDDEVNRLAAGKNYGWPDVAGFNDDRSYAYANWSKSAPDPCASLKFSSLDVPPSVPQVKESTWSHADFVPPLATLFTVPAGYDLRTLGSATIAPGGIDIYPSAVIPGWRRSLLVAGLRTGAVYRLLLSGDGTKVAGPPVEYFKSNDRYRDLAVSPDGRRVILSTDNFGSTMAADGTRTDALATPGALVEYSYTASRQSGR